MADLEPEKPKAMKNGITYTRDFEIVEMSDLAADKSQGPFAPTTTFTVSAAPRPRVSRKKSIGRRWADSFRRAPGLPIKGHHGYQINEGMPGPVQVDDQADDRFYDLRAANARTANSGLARDLKGRHLQMIAIGGSIGTHSPSSHVSTRRRRLMAA